MQKGNFKKFRVKAIARKLHKWMGLIAFWWLAILGITGVFLDHPEWRWQHQTVISGLSTPENPKNGQHLRHPRDWAAHFAVNPDNSEDMISGGPGGAWVSFSSGQKWQPINFEGLSSAPMVYALEPVSQTNWLELWIATDDGLWRSTEGGRNATRIILSGEHVTSLSFDHEQDQFLAVIGKSQLAKIDRAQPDKWKVLEKSATPAEGLPENVSLNRWGFDLHLGTGFFAIPFSIFANDLAGMAMLVLATTGFLYWYLPKRWGKAKSKPAGTKRKAWMVWLYRSHAIFMGLVIIIPLFYLSATGVFLGHKSWFQSWSKDIHVAHAYIPGQYDMASFDDEIEAAGFRRGPDGTTGIVVQTRMGLLESKDDGKSWGFDDSYPFDVNTSWNKIKYQQADDFEMISDVIGRNYVRSFGQDNWEPVSDMPGYTVISMNQSGGKDYVHTLTGIYVGDFASEFQPFDAEIPALPGLDLAFVFRVIHGVLIFNTQLVWLNDAMAIIAIFMVLTGFITWVGRNRKWI